MQLFAVVFKEQKTKAMLKHFFETSFSCRKNNKLKNYGQALSKMKRIFFTAACFFLLTSIAKAQQNNNPQLLKEPADWQFEKFSLPPNFAPAFPYKGFEELRFSPGMFDKNSPQYFTYAFAASLDGINTISENDIQNYLLEYFKGLCYTTAEGRKLSIDTSKITVSIEKKNNTAANENIYNASLNIFGVFADGAPVKLNMEIKVLSDAAASKTYLVFIASPLEKNNTAWQNLYKIQKEFVSPGSN
jgi:hypothetical protein